MTSFNKVMGTIFLLAVAFNVAHSIDYPCLNRTWSPVVARAQTNNPNITITTAYNAVIAQWKAPEVNQSAVVSITGWNNTNGSLVILTTAHPAGFTDTVGYNQSRILYSPLTNTTEIFAQKDIYNNNFNVQLTAQQSQNSTAYFQFYLFNGYYNNLRNNTCENSCSGTPQFLNINGTVIPTAFTCAYNQEDQGIFSNVVNAFVSLF